MSNIPRLIERHAEEAICCFALSVMATCVFLQVIMRYVFHSALQWSEEVAAICMVWAVYMGASLCVRERFHIRIMAGVLLFPAKIARGFVLLADGLAMLYCIFMLVVSVEYLGVLWRFPSHTPSLQIHEFWPQTILVIGHALILIRLMQIYVNWIRSGAGGIPGMRIENDEDAAK